MALVIEPDGTSRTERLPSPDLELLRAVENIVGGFIEAIGIVGEWIAYLNEEGLNEEGKTTGLPANPAADALARRLGWRPSWGEYLCGPVVFTGSHGVIEIDVPDKVLSTWSRTQYHDHELRNEDAT